MHASSTAIVQIMLALMNAVVKLDTKVILENGVLTLMNVKDRLSVRGIGMKVNGQKLGKWMIL